MKSVLATVAVGLGGGTDLVVLTAARALLRAGIEVELRTVEPVDWNRVAQIFPGDTRVPGIALVAGRPSSVGSAAWADRIVRYRRLLRELWRSRGDTIVVNLNGDLLPSPAHLAYVHFPVAAAPKWRDAGPFRSAFASVVAGGLIRLENRAALRHVRPRFIANSGFTQRALRESLGVASDVLFPPARLFFPRPADDAREGSVVTVASFRPRKQLARILGIAALVPGVRFQVAGAIGPHGAQIVAGLRRAAADRGLADRVTFDPELPRTELERRYWTSKVYLHPTPLEHFGISVVEAMRAGCVPVVPRSGGQWTDVLEARDGVWGFGYDTFAEAAEAIRRILGDGPGWAATSARAQDRAQAFTEERFSRSFVRIVQEAVGSVSR